MSRYFVRKYNDSNSEVVSRVRDDRGNFVFYIPLIIYSPLAKAAAKSCSLRTGVLTNWAFN